MSTITLQFTFEVDNVLTDVTSAVLSDSTGAYGVKRDDTDAVVVADGTAMTKTATGTYEYSFTAPADNLEYTWVVEYVYDGTTYRDEFSYIDTTDPVTLSQAKDVCRISGTDHDTHLAMLIDAAVTWAEEYTRRKFLTETITEYLDDWPDVIRPRWSPLIAVTSITYVDSAGTTQTWSSSEYDVDTYNKPGRIEPAYSYSWPTLRGDQNGICLTYTAGYGTSASDVPAHYRHGILLLVHHWFMDPDSWSSRQVPESVKALLGIGRLAKV